MTIQLKKSLNNSLRCRQHYLGVAQVARKLSGLSSSMSSLPCTEQKAQMLGIPLGRLHIIMEWISLKYNLWSLIDQRIEVTKQWGAMWGQMKQIKSDSGIVLEELEHFACGEGAVTSFNKIVDIHTIVNMLLKVQQNLNYILKIPKG